jgi:site-specific recombinase XerD
MNKKDKANALLYARVSVNGERTEISLKEQIKTEEWDAPREVLKGKLPHVKAINKYIEDVRFRLKEKYRMLEEKGFIITANAIKEAYLGIHKSQNSGHKLIELMNYHEEIFGHELSKGTLKNYYTTKDYVIRFLNLKYKTDDILLRELDFQFITEFKVYIRENPIKKHDPCIGNGLMKHMERLKKLIHWAKQLKWITTDPFDDFKLSFKKSKRKKLDLTELNRIESKNFENSKLSYVKDLFLFSCFTGLAYADVVVLKPENFQTSELGTILKIYREKSDELSSVPLLGPASLIIKKYKNHPQALMAGTVFPPISNQEVNRNLKIIAEVCEINKNMTFHLARHTFATAVTLKNGVPIETISKMLGHTKISTTEIYAAVDDEKIMSDMALVESKIERRKSLL